MVKHMTFPQKAFFFLEMLQDGHHVSIALPCMARSACPELTLSPYRRH
jgi:hypothetical protein